MSNEDIIRAWTDEEYRMSLSDAERAALPENPAGLIELDDIALANVSGGVSYQFSGCVTCGLTCQVSVITCSTYGCTQPCYCSSCSFISCC